MLLISFAYVRYTLCAVPLQAAPLALHVGTCVCVCVCVCVFYFPFILDVRLVDIPVGVTQEEGLTGFLIHLPSAVLASIFLARRIQAFLSLVYREVEFCVLTI